MALPLLPILLIGGAVVAAVAMGGSGGSPATGEGGETKDPAPVIPDVAAARAKWASSDWGAKVDELQVIYTDPNDVAVAAAKWAFPDYFWPPLRAMHTNFAVWRTIKTDVWTYLGIQELPFPPD